MTTITPNYCPTNTINKVLDKFEETIFSHFTFTTLVINKSRSFENVGSFFVLPGILVEFTALCTNKSFSKWIWYWRRFHFPPLDRAAIAIDVSLEKFTQLSIPSLSLYQLWLKFSREKGNNLHTKVCCSLFARNCDKSILLLAHELFSAEIQSQMEFFSSHPKLEAASKIQKWREDFPGFSLKALIVRKSLFLGVFFYVFFFLFSSRWKMLSSCLIFNASFSTQKRRGTKHKQK